MKKRVLRLSMILSCCAMVWGALTASYFGISFAPDSPWQKTSVLAYLAGKKAAYHLREKDEAYAEVVKLFPQAEGAVSGEEFLMRASVVEDGKREYPVFEEFSNNVLLEFSFLVGIIHISLSFLRYLKRNVAGFGWVVFMIGGYLFLPSMIRATIIVNFTDLLSTSACYFWGARLMIAGFAFAFLAAFIKKRWGAFHELLHVVQVFADTLSYLRLYALALGGMVMAKTFNDALGIHPGAVLSFLIILAGHGVNLALCLMGSIVHGLRLNFLEWFHYSFDGGGLLFNPLKLNKTK